MTIIRVMYSEFLRDKVIGTHFTHFTHYMYNT